MLNAADVSGRGARATTVWLKRCAGLSLPWRCMCPLPQPHPTPEHMVWCMLAQTEDAESADQIYDLQGAVIHIGSQLTRGHYIALVKVRLHARARARARAPSDARRGTGGFGGSCGPAPGWASACH